MMPVVRTRAEWLRDLEKPPLEALGQIRLHEDDWLVLCAGFEDRTRAVFDAALKSSTTFNVLLINYSPNVTENQAAAIRDCAIRNGLRVVEVTYHRDAPGGFGELVRSSIRDGGRVFIDISAMSRLLIVQIVVSLGARLNGLADCYVVYSEARHYSPSREIAALELKKAQDPSFAVLFLSSGVLEITVVPELASIAPPGPSSRLVVFPSLDSHQLTALRSELQPSRVTVIEGVPPAEENRWRRELIAQINHLEEIVGAERLVASTLDYADNLRILLGVYTRYSLRERLLIAPTGSKMQALAVGILRSVLRDVQIVYPTPSNFVTPSSYTSGIGAQHLVPLSSFSWRRAFQNLALIADVA